MSEMVDRVIAAVEDRARRNPCTMEDVARSAIEAMREPTVEMLVAAQEEWMCVRASEERGDFIWRAMIDKALR